MKLCFIAHGDSSIGMGHVMRCISLAGAFIQAGHQVFFISKKAVGMGKIKEAGMEVIGIPDTGNVAQGFFYGDTGELKEEADHIRSVLESRPAEVVILDSYNVSQEYFLRLKAMTRYLVYIDDINRFLYPADMVINGTASALDMGYQKYDASQRFLLGLDYNMIREEFTGIPPRAAGTSIQEVLITTGGSDPCHMTEALLFLLAQMKDKTRNWRFHVIIGSGFGAYRLPGDLEIVIHKEPPRMSDIMMECDLAITAGGSTLYELAACGVPMLVFSYADNQIPQIRALKAKDYVEYLGGYQEVEEHGLRQGIQWLEPYESRKRMTARLQGLVDGRGPGRIVHEIEQETKRKAENV